MAAKTKSRLSAIEQAKVYSALADPLRVRFMEQVADGQERTGTDLAEELGISLALLCHHSKILVEAGVVEKRKSAQTSYYKARHETLARAFRQLIIQR